MGTETIHVTVVSQAESGSDDEHDSVLLILHLLTGGFDVIEGSHSTEGKLAARLREVVVQGHTRTPDLGRDSPSSIDDDSQSFAGLIVLDDTVTHRLENVVNHVNVLGNRSSLEVVGLGCLKDELNHLGMIHHDALSLESLGSAAI